MKVKNFYLAPDKDPYLLLVKNSYLAENTREALSARLILQLEVPPLSHSIITKICSAWSLTLSVSRLSPYMVNGNANDGMEENINEKLSELEKIINIQNNQLEEQNKIIEMQKERLQDLQK